mgnify:CR=1 FL=1
MAKESRNDKRVARHQRIRKNLYGTPEKPRLCVFRSSKNISVQIIDDVNGVTLASASTVDKELKSQVGYGGNKEAAKAVGEKAVDMIHVKDITKITGYVRGGCSPIGMKKPFPTVFDASAGNFQEIYVSGGRIGLTLKVPVADLLKVTGGKLAAITAEE